MKLLLNVCCGPCATVVIEQLKEEHVITLFFYNPNIEPIEEYKKRMEASEKLAKDLNLPIIIGDYSNIQWHAAVKGMEQEPEGGKRCDICFRLRLEKTAQFAKNNGFEAFTSTLNISPYKDADKINRIGKEIEKKINISYILTDFRKHYMHSVKLSKKHNLYRQRYCGCIYSKPDSL
ncbi:hypothetical protein GF336_03230 [Candidatus Woesearchaeota archaeon]|nr:hypothetical protein [Candidatus Woesearchaeota archaeon]